jgi:hypothetical protein
MMRFWTAFVPMTVMLAALTLPGAATAEGIKYYEDPPFVKIAKDEPSPMEDLTALAEQGDVRAQYILGDMYGKGKGGLAKNHVLAQYWFETAARHGYTAAFIRLAALAKRESDEAEAYKWYTLDADHAATKEAQWSKTARDKLAADNDMSKDDIRAAEKAAKGWLEGQGKAMKEITKREQAGKAAAAQAAAAAAGEANTSDAETEKTAAKDEKDTKELTKQKQEYRYNE